MAIEECDKLREVHSWETENARLKADLAAAYRDIERTAADACKPLKAALARLRDEIEGLRAAVKAVLPLLTYAKAGDPNGAGELVEALEEMVR